MLVSRGLRLLSWVPEAGTARVPAMLHPIAGGVELGESVGACGAWIESASLFRGGGSACENSSFAPLGLVGFPLLPTACAVGCILTPLRGCRLATALVKRCPDTNRPFFSSL